MSMLEKICDAKNTLEGKALAVFMAVVMVFSLSNITAFADAAADAASGDAAVQSGEGSGEIVEPDAGTEPVQPPSVETPAEPETAPEPSAAPTPVEPQAPSSDGASADKPEPPADQPASVEPGVAVVGLDFEHAYVKCLGQDIKLPAETFNFPLNKEIAFTALADEGHEIDKVQTVVDGVEADLAADEQTGEYKVPADQVTSKLTIKVTGRAVETESPKTDTPAADPITDDTLIEPGETVDQAPGETDGETVEAEAEDVVLTTTVENTTITLAAAEGALPEGATLRAVPLEGADVEQVAQKKAAEEGRELVGYVAFDVTLHDVEGNEIQPSGKVSITVESAALNAGETSLYHADGNIADVEKVAEGTEALLGHLSPVLAIETRAATDALSISGTGSEWDPYLIPVGEAKLISATGPNMWSWYTASDEWGVYPYDYATMEPQPMSSSTTVTGTKASDHLFVVRALNMSSYTPQLFYFKVVAGESGGGDATSKDLAITGGDTVAKGQRGSLSLVLGAQPVDPGRATWTTSDREIVAVMSSPGSDHKGANVEAIGLKLGTAVVTASYQLPSGETLTAEKTITVTDYGKNDPFSYKFRTDSSNVQLFYSIGGAPLAELGMGDMFTAERQVPVAFYVKVRDGYAPGTKFSHYFGWDSDSVRPMGSADYTDLRNNMDLMAFPGVFDAAHGEAYDYGCTYEFHYSAQDDQFRYREFTIGASPILVNVAYVLDGGTLNGSPVHSDPNTYVHENVTDGKYASYAKEIAFAGAPEKANSLFQGWRLSVNGNEYAVMGADEHRSVAQLWTYIKDNLEKGSEECTITLTALWAQEAQYTVTYNGNGNTGGSATIDRGLYYAGDSATVLESSYRKANSTFTGWNTSADGSGTAYAPGETIEMAGNVTLYAQWGDKGKVRIEYRANPAHAGTLSAYGESVDPDDGVAKGSTASAHAGYAFVNWTDADGNVVSEEEGLVPATPELGWPATGAVFTAHFAAETTTPYTVERYLQNVDGSYPDAATHVDAATGTTGETVSADTAVSYEGFTFDADNAGNVLEGTVAGDGSLVLKVHYERNSYEVAYAYDRTPEGASALPAPSYHKYGAAVDVAAGATAPGYAFAGWSTGDATVEGGSFAMPAKNVTLTGTWTANQATVEVWFYDLNGTAHVLTEANTLSTTGAENAHTKTITSDSKSGYAEDELKQLAATAYDLTPEQDRYAGYEMEVSDGADGWEPLASLESHVIQGGETVRYHVNPEGTRTVTYKAGDHGEGADFVAGSYFKGDTVTQKKDLEGTGIVAKPGYSFAGWTTDDAIVDADGTFAMPGRGVAFTAQWAPNDGTAYTVEHYRVSADGATATLVGEALHLAGTTGTTVEAEALSIPGYTYQPDFNENGMTTVASGTVAGNGSLVLKLYYTPDADSLAYDANHGTGAMPPTAGVTDGDVTVAQNGFAREGFKFTGWNAAADGTGDAYAPGATYRLTAEDDVLYAQWTEQATLTYDLNGGSGIAPEKQQVDKGTTITEFASGDGLSNGGARFKGWAADPNSLEPLTELTMNESKTVYAIWVDVYHVYYGVQQYSDPDNPSKIVLGYVHPEGAPTEFEVKAGESFPDDSADRNQPLSWMPNFVMTTEKGVDGSAQATKQNFQNWDKSNPGNIGTDTGKNISVYYTAAVESNSLSDGDVTVKNADRENYAGLRQGMVTVRTHYLDAAGNVEHAQLTGEALTRYQGTKRTVTEQLHFAWQADNAVSLAVQNSNADWVLNKVVRSDNGAAVAAGSGATLSDVAGNSTVDIYLTPKYTVSYFDATDDPAQALPGLAQAGTVPVADAAGGTSLLPAGMGLIADLAAQALPTRDGHTYEPAWNTTAAFDGTAVAPGSGMDLALFGEGRALSLYAKGTLNAYEVAYRWNADAAPADAVLPTGGTYNHGDAFTVDTAYTKDTRVELTDEFGNVTDVYTFSGWNTGDFAVTGPRTIEGVWTHTENTIPQARVTYEWDGPVPVGATLPVDGTSYTLNQPYTVDTTYTSQIVVEMYDDYGNVNGRYTFSGWNDENASGKMVEGGVVIKGTWELSSVPVATHSVSYEWTGDVPEGTYAQNLPQPVVGLVNGQDYTVDAKFTSETSIPHYDEYGNVDGHYTFSGWSLTGAQTMGDADVTVTGTWTLAPQDVPAYGVTYQWTNAPDGDYAQTLPVDGTRYVKGQPYTVDATFVAGETKVSHLDQYGNVDGTWTFLGWNDAHEGVMVEGGVTVTGAWSYAPVDVDAHNVIYEWTGAPTGQNAPALPIDANAYVPGQAYTVDATFTNASAIDDLDAYGNVKGVWTFGGWDDPNAGTMGNGDVVITGEWVYAATPVQKHGVAYDWGTENVPAGVTLPQDFGRYVPGQPYAVDAEYAANMRIDAFDEHHNLNGYYTFSGWNDPGEGVMGASDVTITGAWSFTPVDVPAYGVAYDWGTVAAEVAAAYQLPVNNETYVRGQNYPLDATQYQPVSTYDAYGNVNGTWTFGGWNDAHGGVMVEGGVTVTGAWTYAPVDVEKRTVSYDWGTQDVPAEAQLPASIPGLVKGQGYEVDDTYTHETVIETHDEYGNVNGRYTFSGWTDPANGTVGDADVVITGSWSYSDVAVPAHGVTYTWTNAPDGDFEQTLPVDGARYVKGQGYAVDAAFVAGHTVDHLDAYGNVDGTWTFRGWNDPNAGIMGDADVTISGSWSYEAADVAKRQVNYEWTGDVPGGTYAQALPAAIRDLVKGQPYQVDTAYASGMTVDRLDAYGNVDGTWTFQGWTDPNAGVMGDADVTVTGAWAYEEVGVPTHQVKYDWGQAAPEILAAYSLPASVDGLVKGQPYAVDPTVYQPVNTVDQYGNVNGTYTFSGWTDPNNGLMGGGDVTISGTWTYQSEDVQTYGVKYEWTGAPTGSHVQSLPTNPNAYVKGQNYPVDTTFVRGSTVESTDAYGNVNGRWTFSGWTDPGAGTMPEGGVTLTGSWSYEPIAVAQHKVDYQWMGDVPEGAYAQTLPASITGLVKGQAYNVDAKHTSETSIPHYDQYGNVDGAYVFGGWSQTGRQTMGDADVVITGEWKLVPQEVSAHSVTYEWTNAPDGEYEQTLPVDGARYVKGQGYAVDATFVAGHTVDHLDAYGNVDGTWTFRGWNDPNAGIMGDADVTISGSWSYEAADVAKRQVNYEWTGDVPGGTYAQALPAAIRDLVKGQPYQVDTAYASGMTVDRLDAYGNVDGTWTFQGWTDPNAGVMGDADVTVTGAWAYEEVVVAKRQVSYDWGTRNVPVGAQLPAPQNGLVKGQSYAVDGTFAAGTTVNHTDAFGNVDGTYVFSGWSLSGTQTMGDADVVVTGSWSYEPVAVAQHQVRYEWTGAVPAGAQLPAALTGLVKGQPYTADATFYNGYRVTDATGVYTFSGWADPNAGVMGDADVVLAGSWTYEAAEYTVVYNWTNPPATAVIPAGGTFAYGDAFTVDTEFAAGAQASDATGTWTFGGWSTGDFTVEGNVTITGTWTFEATEYVVRFVDYDDAELGTGTYAYGDAVTAPADPTRADEDGVRYTFAGWRAEDGTVHAGTAVPTVTGNAVYTAVYTSAAVPATPVTPPTPTAPTPETPTPAPTPGTPPADDPLAPIVAPVAEALQDAAETVIGPAETPLAGPEEQVIDDNGNPLAGYDRVNCWVHYYLILGIIVTLIYGAAVLVRRMSFAHRLKGFENDVLGIEDESAAATAPAAPFATEGKEA